MDNRSTLAEHFINLNLKIKYKIIKKFRKIYIIANIYLTVAKLPLAGMFGIYTI